MRWVKRTVNVGDVARETIPLTVGAVIREPGSTVKYHTGAWRVFRPVIRQEKCVKCAACWRCCPDAAIYVENSEYRVNYDYCKGCLICVKECPVKAIDKELERK